MGGMGQPGMGMMPGGGQPGMPPPGMQPGMNPGQGGKLNAGSFWPGDIFCPSKAKGWPKTLTEGLILF